MIFEINLLKDRAKLKRRRGFLRIILYGELLLFFITHLIILSCYLNLSYKIKDTERNLLVLSEDIIFLSEEGVKLSSLKEMNEKYSEITSQLSTINELMENRVLLSHKLKGLSQILPEDIWIDGFYITETNAKTSQKTKEKAKLISLNGLVMADREEAFIKIQSFIRDLENEPLFKEGIDSIELSSISKPRTGSFKEFMEFKISCWIIRK